MSVPDTVEVDVVVKSAEQAGEGDKDYKTTLEIPYFKSKYPTTVYVPTAVSLKKGQALTVNLTKGKLSKDDYDGTAYWHWNWRWGSIRARPATAPPGAAAPPESPDRRKGLEYRTDATGISIERQTSLYAAASITVARLAAGHYKAEESVTYHTAQIADYFARWLQGKVAVKAIGAAPEIEDAASKPTPSPVVGQTPPTAKGEEIDDVGVLFTRLRQEHPKEFPDTAHILAYYSVKKATDIKDPAGAYVIATKQLAKEEGAHA